MYSECLSVFVKNRFCLFSHVLLGDSHLKIIYLLRWVELFIEYLLMPNMEVGPGIDAKIKATLSVPSWKLRSGGGICHTL